MNIDMNASFWAISLLLLQRFYQADLLFRCLDSSWARVPSSDFESFIEFGLWLEFDCENIPYLKKPYAPIHKHIQYV